MGYFKIMPREDRDIDDNVITGKSDRDPLVAFGNLLTGISDAWDVEADDSFFQRNVAEAFHEMCKMADDESEEAMGWWQPMEVDQVFDMDMSGVVIQWVPEEDEEITDTDSERDRIIREMSCEHTGLSEEEYCPPDSVTKIQDRDGWFQLLWLDGITVLAIVNVSDRKWQLIPTEID